MWNFTFYYIFFSSSKKMLRFDPTQTDHSKYEIVNNEQLPRKKKKHNSEKEIDTMEDQNNEQPQVSKDVFFNVDDGLAHSLQDKGGFSFLNLFGKNIPSEENNENEGITTELQTKQTPLESRLPHFDSSDEEVDEVVENNQGLETKTETNNIWSEPFFFTDDDYRLQGRDNFYNNFALLIESTYLFVFCTLPKFQLV